MEESYVKGPANHCGLEPYAGDGNIPGVALARGTGSPRRLSSEETQGHPFSLLIASCCGPVEQAIDGVGRRIACRHRCAALVGSAGGESRVAGQELRVKSQAKAR